jgi:hypothetical protein
MVPTRSWCASTHNRPHKFCQVVKVACFLAIEIWMATDWIVGDVVVSVSISNQRFGVVFNLVFASERHRESGLVFALLIVQAGA